MAEVSDTKTSGTSLISSINQSGSGIDLSGLVTGLVSAETSTIQSKLTKKVDATNLQVSSYGQLSSRLDSLSTSLTTIESTNARSATSSGAAASLSVTNEANAKDVNSNITVSSVAIGQVVTFDLTDANFVGSNSVSTASAIDTGTISFVMNGTTSTITINSSNNSVQGLANEINKISGAQANIVDTTGSGGLSLVVKSDFGTKNAFTMTSSNGLEEFNTSGLSSAEPAVSAFSAGSTSPAASGFTASNTGATITFSGAVTSGGNVKATVDGIEYEVNIDAKSSVTLQAAELATKLNALTSFKTKFTAKSVDGVVTIAKPNMLTVTAADSIFKVDGLEVTRSSNIVTDLFEGYSLNINAISTTPINITSAVLADDATTKMNTFLAEVNAITEYLKTETKRGLNGAESGSLAGDFTANRILQEFRTLTTQEIPGYGGSSYYLANLGVKTERDGSLKLDSTKFEAAIAADPEIANIIFASKFSSASDKLSVSGSSNYPPTAGEYSFAFTQSTGVGVINGVTATSSTNSAGNKVFSSGTSGSAKNMYIELLDSSSDLSSNVRYGESLVDKLQSYITSITSSTGVLITKTTSLNDELSVFADEQINLDDKIENLTSMYNSRFGAMEGLVTQLNKTGEYLTSMMDAWSNAKK